jgi:hypothetical protein
MLNQGPVVDHFRIALRGLPNTWTPSLPPPVQLMPGAQQSVILTIQPPRTSQTRAGDYNFAVRVVSQDAPAESVEVPLTLSVGAFGGYSSEFHPQRILDSKQPGSPSATRVTGRRLPDQHAIAVKRSRSAHHRPRWKSKRVKVVLLSSAPRHVKNVGLEENKSTFSLQVADSAGETQSHTGELVGRSGLPAWLLPSF